MFRTELHPTPLPVKIRLTDSILTIGSCFSDTIGQQLNDHKLTTLINPFGTIYNPVSIHRLIELAADKRMPDEAGYALRDDVHIHYDFHSKFDALSRQALESSIQNSINLAHQFLQDADWLMITYGTAWVYRLKSTGHVVANCHKMPGSWFAKELLPQHLIITSFDTLYKKLKSKNQQLRILLTVSPVRHVRDTLELNSVSKAALRLACYELSTRYTDVYYFPAYEILLDDLRDYRFYAPDLIHPSKEAEHYIWQKFTECCMDEHLRAFVQEWNFILQALAHRPYLPESKSHQRFVKETIRRLDKLKSLVNVEHEMATLMKQLHAPQT